MRVDIYVWITPKPVGIFDVSDENAPDEDDYNNGWERLDLDDSVQINLKNKIKDSRDIAKVYQPVTLPFKVPATKPNNQIFKRWHDPVFGSQFDARQKMQCVIKLGGLDWRYGHLSLRRVDTQMDEPQWYNVQFSDSLAALKDVFLGDTLNTLDSLNVYNHAYAPTGPSEQSVRWGLSDGLTFGGAIDTGPEPAVIYPFISNQRGFQYDGTNGVYDVLTLGAPSNTDRLSNSDLNPAVSAPTILEAIGEKYGIEFTGNFLETNQWKDLYIWCNRYKGGLVIPKYQEEEYPNLNSITIPFKGLTLGSFTCDPSDSIAACSTAIDVWDQEIAGTNEQDWSRDWEVGGPSGAQIIRTDPDIFIVYDDDRGHKQRYNLVYDISFTGATTSNYEVLMTVDYTDTTGASGRRTFRESPSGNFTSGTITLDFNTFGGQGDRAYLIQDITFQVYKTSGGLNPFDFTVDIDGIRDMEDTAERTRTWNDYVFNVTSGMLTRFCNIPYNLPNIEIMEFLRGIFNMFNLTVVPDTDGGPTKIRLETLDTFYEQGDTFNVTEWADFSRTSVERISPYNQIEFKYESRETIFAKRNDKAVLGRYGDLTWQVGSGTSFIYDGGKYEVELPFEKMLYERMSDQNAPANRSDILWGWCVDDFTGNVPESVETAPVLFYRRKIEPTHTSGTFGNGLAYNLGYSSSTATLSEYNAPSNTLISETVQVGDSYTVIASLNWGQEFDEFGQDRVDPPEFSLFNDYYFSYINGIYDRNAKLLKITLRLPMNLVRSIKTDSTLQIRNTLWTVEELQTNPNTGKVKAQLRAKLTPSSSSSKD